MTINEKHLSTKRAAEGSTTHYRLAPIQAQYAMMLAMMLAIMLTALLALTALPVYSSSHTASGFKTAQIVPLSEGLHVTPALDSGHATTQIVPAAGGAVTATGADGTKFTLIVPSSALLSAAEITMTPITAAGGLPLSGGLAAAVQLEPPGLRLFTFATLIIEPPQSLSPNQETSFSWNETGDDFHLFAMQTPNSTKRENAKGAGPALNPRGLNFKLLHFSSYGVGIGTDADRAAQQLRTPAGSEAGFEQRLEAILDRERKRQLATAQSGTQAESVKSASDEDDPGSIDAIIQELKDRYTNDVKPAMDSSLLSRDDLELECAMLKALVCNRQIDLLIGDAELTGKTAKFFKKARKAISGFVENALEILAANASKRCSKDHKPEEVVALLGISRQQLLLRGNGFCKCDGEKTFELARQCAHFEVEFDSETELNDPAATVKTHVHATVPLQISFSGPLSDTTGEAPLVYLSCEWTPKDPQCTASNTTTGATFRVLGFNIDLNPRYVECNKKTMDGKLNLISVEIDPGLPKEIITETCTRPGGRIEKSTIPQVIWVGTFGEFHLDETDDATGAIVISGWEEGNGSLLARKTYSRSGLFDGFPMTERTAINLWHRPE